MNMEINSEQENRAGRCPLQSVTVADTLSSSINVVSCISMAEAERPCWLLAGAAHSTSHGYARWQATYKGGTIKYPTSCFLPTFPPLPYTSTYISPHLSIPLLSLASTLDTARSQH